MDGGNWTMRHSELQNVECFYRIFCLLTKGSDEEGRHDLALAAMAAMVAVGKR